MFEITKEKDYKSKKHRRLNEKAGYLCSNRIPVWMPIVAASAV